MQKREPAACLHWHEPVVASRQKCELAVHHRLLGTRGARSWPDPLGPRCWRPVTTLKTRILGASVVVGIAAPAKAGQFRPSPYSGGQPAHVSRRRQIRSAQGTGGKPPPRRRGSGGARGCRHCGLWPKPARYVHPQIEEASSWPSTHGTRPPDHPAARSGHHRARSGAQDLRLPMNTAA